MALRRYSLISWLGSLGARAPRQLCSHGVAGFVSFAPGGPHIGGTGSGITSAKQSCKSSDVMGSIVTGRHILHLSSCVGNVIVRGGMCRGGRRDGGTCAFAGSGSLERVFFRSLGDKQGRGADCSSLLRSKMR